MLFMQKLIYFFCFLLVFGCDSREEWFFTVNPPNGVKVVSVELLTFPKAHVKDTINFIVVLDDQSKQLTKTIDPVLALPGAQPSIEIGHMVPVTDHSYRLIFYDLQNDTLIKVDEVKFNPKDALPDKAKQYTIQPYQSTSTQIKIRFDWMIEE